MRSLGLKKPDLKPVAGHEATFTIADPKGNVIFKQQDVTSRFGIASADCPLAAEIIEGEYQIRCTVGSDHQQRDGDGREVRAAQVQGGRDAGQAVLRAG